MPDQQSAADQYTTPLAADQQQGYQSWLATMQKAVGHELSTDDYDMQGAYLAGAKPAPNAHFDDQFKKPYHMTFSTDSQYNGKPFVGGTWTQDKGHWAFRASADNLKFHSQKELVDYFKAKEPTSVLYLPGEDKPAYDGSRTRTPLSEESEP